MERSDEAILWRPGRGCDPRALARMRAAFPLPREPMGEAWFLGESRSMYNWLYDDLEDLPLRRAEYALEAIASGTSSFGALEEWTAWFHYLLPRLLPRCHERSLLDGSTLLDGLVTAFVTQYPAGVVDAPYPGFRADALATLGRAMMEANCWPDDRLDMDTGLSRGYFAGLDAWHWWMVSGKLSASLFFCLKYLDAAAIGPWLKSVLAIRSPLFVGQMIAWLVGAEPLLAGAMAQPADLPERGYPDITWFWSYCLRGNYTGDHGGNVVPNAFLPAENRMLAEATIVAHVNSSEFADWLAAISTESELEAELGELPFDLCRLYARQ